MSDFKNRLFKEESDLLTKINKLYDFTQSDKFDEVDDVQQGLLLIQLEAMRTYYIILTIRISQL